ncbi:MAG: TonB-dependent receptor [Acidobacteriia bacterium]|nr:TonB-dependent receptor [Terriglobia bacterium]
MRFSVRVLFLRSFFVSACLFLFAQFAAAQNQSTGKLTCAVSDPRGAVIAGAQISAESIPPSGEAIRGVSASDGVFTLTLPAGHYRITISHDSFSRFDEEISIAAGEARDLQVRLALEPLSSKVVVTAQTLPLDAESSPAPATILTREQIEQRVATSLPDLLATLPGFSLGRTGPEGGSASLFLDGGNSNYTKVLVDGAPLNTPGGFIDFSDFTPDNIDKIEIVHGAESALYGSDAMDGVIQIFTRRGTSRIPEFTAFADGGNFASGRGGAELSGLLGRFDYSSGVSDLETAGQGVNDAFRDRTLSGNFGWRFSESARASLSLRDNVSAAGTPGQTLLQPASPTDSIGLHNFTASLHTEFTTGPHWHSQLNGTEFYFRELNHGSFGDTLYQYNRSRFAGQSSYLVKGFGITAGYEYEVENGFISYIGFHARRNNQAGFLDARWQPVSRLTLSAGVRADDNADFGTRVVPRAGASYALRIASGAFGDTRLRASYGQGIVEPRFDQTFGTDPCFTGNPNLSPERSRTVHAGIEQKLASDRLRVTVDYFDSRFRDIISFQSDPVTFCGTFFNTNLARARGANFSSEARVTHWLSASANYTYDSTRTLSAPTDPVNLDPNYLPGSRLLRRPVNSGNAMLNANFLGMNWNLSGYFTGERFDYNYPGQIINPGYARFDLAVSYHMPHGFSVYGRIMNLADKQYQDAYGYPALGREFRIGVKYTTRAE